MANRRRAMGVFTARLSTRDRIDLRRWARAHNAGNLSDALRDIIAERRLRERQGEVGGAARDKAA